MVLRSLLVLALVSVAVRLGAVELIDPPTAGRPFETLRFRFEENLGHANPFDLESNRVELLIQSPDSLHRTLSFFYDGSNDNGIERWEARFTPAQTGVYRFRVCIRGKEQPAFQVPVASSGSRPRGGLKISDRPGMLEYEGGGTFRGIGLNVCWAPDFEYYFRKMHAAGMTVARIWMCPWSLPMEWKHTGLGRYDLGTARRIDSLLALAKTYGIYVILCLDFHGIAARRAGFFRENRWLENPYNAINGGPCGEPADLFTDQRAQQFLRRKYKYIVSRFGHSAQIAMWEFFNEADLMAGKPLPMNRWHSEMAAYVKSVDVHGRIISSSATRQYVEKLVDGFRSPAIDLVMFHDYNSVNVAPHFTDLIETAVEFYHKPVVLGEFGVEFRGADRTMAVDPQNVGFHNGIWSGWFSETPIVPLSWWWDNLIDPNDLWREYAVLARFAELLPIEKTLLFTEVTPGVSKNEPRQPVACMVRCLLNGERSALWLKNEDYQWSLLGKGQEPKPTGDFIQPVPGLQSGRYLVTWFDPQTGVASPEAPAGVINAGGSLELAVASFTRDKACVLRRIP